MATPLLQDVNEAFNHLVFLLHWLLFISVCRNQRNTQAWKKAAIEHLYLVLPPWWGINCLLINEPFRAVPELGLRGRRREKAGGNQLLCSTCGCFLGCQEGVKEPQSWWCYGMVVMVGRQRGKSQSWCVSEGKEREKWKQQFNLMSAFTPLEWRRGKLFN